MECRGVIVVLTTDNFINREKWSDCEERVVLRDGAREESEVITRSRM